MLLLTAFAVCAQDAPPKKEGGHGGPPKNLKLLKPEEVRPMMGAFRVALGPPGCALCHVQGDFASDDKHHKIVARKMIELVRSINPKFPDGKEHVTCYTCHRGAEEPLTAPPAAQ
jgi:photosynthetic reaction center cytochrome c subunit